MPDMKKGNGRGWIIFVGVLFVIAFWVGSGLFVCDLYPEVEKAGQFGDMFGFINSLFSGLAMAGVLITIWFQREEMKQQRKEMARQQEASNTTIAWSIFDQHLKALGRLQSTEEYKGALSEITEGTLRTLSTAVGGGSLVDGKPQVEFGDVLDDNTEDLTKFKEDLDISIYNTDKNKNVFKMLKIVDVISKVIIRYGDNNQLLVGTLFAQLSDEEVRILIYKCIADGDYYKRLESVGFFSCFFSHAFRNALHVKKFFPNYKISDGFLVKKA